jgi:hypothetical protein
LVLRQLRRPVALLSPRLLLTGRGVRIFLAMTSHPTCAMPAASFDAGPELI